MEGMSSGGVASDWYRALYSNPPRNSRPTHTHTLFYFVTSLVNNSQNAPAENQTRGPMMATLDLTTKPLALDMFLYSDTGTQAPVSCL
jgi:hypothetical protein